MAFGSFDRKTSSQPMAEINMVPLIDVVLVLLVIFIVTAPLLTNVVKLDLPKAASAADIQKPEKVEFAIDANGGLFWKGERITREDAIARFAEEGRKRPQPEVYLRADQNVPYRYVAETLADASKGGLSKVAFVSEPVASMANSTFSGFWISAVEVALGRSSLTALVRSGAVTMKITSNTSTTSINGTMLISAMGWDEVLRSKLPKAMDPLLA